MNKDKFSIVDCMCMAAVVLAVILLLVDAMPKLITLINSMVV